MKEVVDKVKFTAVKALTRLTLSALENATLQIEAQAMQFTNAKLPPLRQESQAVAERFMSNLTGYFDALTSLTIKEPTFSDSDDMTLVDHDFLEAIIAMEGMVNHARKNDIQQYISFTTRLTTLFPNARIDETNNPLDPEQIGDSFNESIRPLGLKAHYLLTIYREFNKSVFQNLEDVIAEANEVLIDLGVLPKLDLKARSKQLLKEKLAEDQVVVEDIPSPAAQAKSEKEMFAMMQTLVANLASQKNPDTALLVSAEPNTSEHASSATDSAEERRNIQQQQTQLMQALSEIQSSLMRPGSAATPATADSRQITESIKQSLNQESTTGGGPTLNAESSDVINLVTMLYEAIWNDASLPVLMKELIGRTQIPIIKVALSDTAFFDNEQHPARIILNEFALAGIAWTETEQLNNDPTYLKVKSLVERILLETDLSNRFLQSLINELRAFKAQHGSSDANLEQRIRETDNHSERLDDVHEFVNQKINERVLKGYLDPSIRKLLDTHIHDFLVKLVVKEGPSGGSWKPVMSTIDVMLWTVQSEKQPGDKEKFDKINPRLLDNLAKALEIGGASKTKITRIIRQLKQVQEYSFHQAAAKMGRLEQAISQPNAAASASSNDRRARREPPPLPRDDLHLRQVDRLPIGVWLEFKGSAGHPVRCTLAAKIESIDKLFFVNRQGEKALEINRMRLARELKAGSVKIVSEGSLVDRAMESVISDLKNSKASPQLEDSGGSAIA